jgi:phage-related minor tail protein
MNPPTLSPAAVLELARLEGHAHLDAETAQRVAVGASNAVRAVTATVDESLFDVEPLHYLAELERLADAD